METFAHDINYSFIFLFKSYYVVWKQRWKEIDEGKDESLNRTMQYGNFYEKQAPYGNRGCLNRTMQYGNSRLISEKVVDIGGLNRTMQYGNKIRKYSAARYLLV